MGTRRSIFRNSQWEVTRSGLSSLRTSAPCCYQIDAESLLDTECHDGSQLYDWPLYVTQKPWVDPALFFEALEAAIAAHEGRYQGKVDPDRLRASFDEAQRRLRHRTVRQPARRRPRACAAAKVQTP